MERIKALYGALFSTLLITFALLGSTAVHGGVTVFNIEWLFFFVNLILLGMAGYVIRLVLEEGLDRGDRKTKRGNVLAGLITILALFVAIKLILERRPEKLFEGGGAVKSIEGVWYYVTSGDFRVVLRELPAVFYLLPFIVFLILVITVKRRKRSKVAFEIKFNPEMRYEALEGTPAERVIKMYKNVVAGLVMKGYPYRKSWTHREHEKMLREIFPDLEDLDVLTRIFEKAKYAGRLNDDDVKLARKSYERLMSLLR
ncbi:DUF4129 domain-containing protein [Thermococcus sp. LS1]|uniref:DUF4129 domain-containing protein n=1 Tax=Thermococcus sp. LS1 TaxID=1638259 RepID=UPI00143AD135|nr:DUF4129 domain-containing protein [Thermococcus sp. LS1]NJD99621.1 DUF4129 domain-containing protein [Thermococcus sp. LS1]